MAFRGSMHFVLVLLLCRPVDAFLNLNSLFGGGGGGGCGCRPPPPPPCPPPPSCVQQQPSQCQPSPVFQPSYQPRPPPPPIPSPFYPQQQQFVPQSSPFGQYAQAPQQQQGQYAQAPQQQQVQYNQQAAFNQYQPQHAVQPQPPGQYQQAPQHQIAEQIAQQFVQSRPQQRQPAPPSFNRESYADRPPVSVNRERQSGDSKNSPRTRINAAKITEACNSDEMWTIMSQNIVAGEVQETKRRLHFELNLALEETAGNVDVMCWNGVLSYRIAAKLFCEVRSDDMACFAFSTDLRHAVRLPEAIISRLMNASSVYKTLPVDSCRGIAERHSIAVDGCCIIIILSICVSFVLSRRGFEVLI